MSTLVTVTTVLPENWNDFDTQADCADVEALGVVQHCCTSTSTNWIQQCFKIENWTPWRYLHKYIHDFGMEMCVKACVLDSLKRVDAHARAGRAKSKLRCAITGIKRLETTQLFSMEPEPPPPTALSTLLHRGIKHAVVHFFSSCWFDINFKRYQFLERQKTSFFRFGSP